MTKEEFIDNCTNTVINKYLENGGKENRLGFEAIYWFFLGLYDREGESACKDYIKNWTPRIEKQTSRGYV